MSISTKSDTSKLHDYVRFFKKEIRITTWKDVSAFYYNNDGYFFFQINHSDNKEPGHPYVKGTYNLVNVSPTFHLRDIQSVDIKVNSLPVLTFHRTDNASLLVDKPYYEIRRKPFSKTTVTFQINYSELFTIDIPCNDSNDVNMLIQSIYDMQLLVNRNEEIRLASDNPENAVENRLIAMNNPEFLKLSGLLDQSIYPSIADFNNSNDSRSYLTIEFFSENSNIFFPPSSGYSFYVARVVNVPQRILYVNHPSHFEEVYCYHDYELLDPVVRLSSNMFIPAPRTNQIYLTYQKTYLVDFDFSTFKELQIYYNDWENPNYFYREYERMITNRTAKYNGEGEIYFPSVAQYFTLIETDKILIENGLKGYGIYEVNRSNHPDIKKGINFYAFDDEDNLLIMAPPYKLVEEHDTRYIIFDASLYETNRLVKIPKSEILNYRLYGTEMMQSSVTTNTRPSEIEVVSQTKPTPYKRPSLTATAFSAILFGSTFTLLKGVGKELHNQTNVLGNKLEGLSGRLNQVVEAINNISITTEHKIVDTNRVQIVLSNKRDIEIDGISIFYDLNRMYPHLDNQKEFSDKQVEQISTESSSSVTDELMKLKKMLDDGIIDQQEFKTFKKKLMK